MAWTSAHHAFAVEMFKTGELVIATEQAFHAHFILYQNDATPNKKLMLLFIQNSNSLIEYK